MICSALMIPELLCNGFSSAAFVLMDPAADNSRSVHFYRSSTMAWSMSWNALSEGRGYIAAASVGKLCLFAGGWVPSCTLLSSMPARVEFEFLHCGRPAAESSNTYFTSAAHYSDAVDVYNSETGAWSTAKLSVARGYLAAASVGNAALFAGGKDSVVDCILYFSWCNCF